MVASGKEDQGREGRCGRAGTDIYGVDETGRLSRVAAEKLLVIAGREYSADAMSAEGLTNPEKDRLFADARRLMNDGVLRHLEGVAAAALLYGKEHFPTDIDGSGVVEVRVEPDEELRDRDDDEFRDAVLARLIEYGLAFYGKQFPRLPGHEELVAAQRARERPEWASDWLLRAVRPRRGGFVTSMALWQSYSHWHREEGEGKPVTKQAIARAIEREFGVKAERQVNSGIQARGFPGLRLDSVDALDSVSRKHPKSVCERAVSAGILSNASTVSTNEPSAGFPTEMRVALDRLEAEGGGCGPAGCLDPDCEECLRAEKWRTAY